MEIHADDAEEASAVFLLCTDFLLELRNIPRIRQTYPRLTEMEADRYITGTAVLTWAGWDLAPSELFLRIRNHVIPESYSSVTWGLTGFAYIIKLSRG